MSRLQRVGALYEASARLSASAHSMALFAAGDPDGALLQKHIQTVMRMQLADDVPIVNELIAIARVVRWRDLVQPTPDRFDHDSDQILSSVQRLSFQLEAMLDPAGGAACSQLVESVRVGIGRRHIPTAELLLESLREGGTEGCVLTIAATGARQRFSAWLEAEELQVPVHSVGSLMGIAVAAYGYFVGPPSLFGTRVTTAPRCVEQSFIIPSWCHDRKVPRTEVSAFATGGLNPRVQVFTVGESEAVPEADGSDDEEMTPQPVWTRPATRSSVGDDEVLAKEVHLAGGVTMWLDRDGDSIRTLDPDESLGHRVELRPVASIRTGSFLVYREGETESDALLRLAYQELGARSELVRSRQSEWKRVLKERLRDIGTTEATRQLRALGVEAAAQVRAWASDTVVRPRSDGDFQQLLAWLGAGVGEHFEAANQLRSARLRAANRVTRALETALGKADMQKLEDQGELMVELDLDGFAAMTAGKVLAVSPHECAIPRHDLRIARRGGTSQWLE